jgi:MFS family permease
VEDKLKANADPNAGQLVILKSDQLGAAQTAVKILKALSSLLLIAVFALYALAIYLARGRRRLLLGATGASLVFVGLVIASLRHFLGGVIVDSLVKTEANKHPVSVIWAIETSVMRDIAIILVVYGALVLLATVLAGPNRPAVAIRRWLARGVQKLRECQRISSSTRSARKSVSPAIRG